MTVDLFAGLPVADDNAPELWETQPALFTIPVSTANTIVSRACEAATG